MESASGRVGLYLRRVVVNRLCHGLADGNGWRSLRCGEGVRAAGWWSTDGERVNGWRLVSTGSTQDFGVGEGVRAGWGGQRTLSPRQSTSVQADSRKGTDGGRFRQGLPCGYDVDTASLVNHQLAPRLRGGGGCPCGGGANFPTRARVNWRYNFERGVP